jgi:hypothetical protein
MRHERRQGVLTNSAISHVEMAQGKLLPRVVTKPRKAGVCDNASDLRGTSAQKFRFVSSIKQRDWVGSVLRPTTPRYLPYLRA